MSENISKSSAKRGKPTYLYSIIGVAIVLFLLGLLGLLVINAEKFSRVLKERLEIQVMLLASVNEAQAMDIKKSVESIPHVKFVDFVNKEDAAKEYQQAVNEDFVSILGFNPLGHSLNIKVDAEYIQSDSLQVISNQLKQITGVDQISFQKELVSSISSNIRKASIILGILSLILIFSVVILIDNTVRLAMFSHRFSIKTMQMVGATRWFIAKPFNLKGIRNGFISGLIAILLLYGLNAAILSFIPEIKVINSQLFLWILFIIILLLGIFITFFSTHRSVIKYLKTSLDDLY